MGTELAHFPKQFSGARAVPGSRSAKLLLFSKVFGRMTYAVKPFDFEFVVLRLLPPLLLNGERDCLREKPDLFGQVEDGQANELK
jgi:hypothetical protein